MPTMAQTAHLDAARRASHCAAKPALSSLSPNPCALSSSSPRCPLPLLPPLFHLQLGSSEQEQTIGPSPIPTNSGCRASIPRAPSLSNHPSTAQTSPVPSGAPPQPHRPESTLPPPATMRASPEAPPPTSTALLRRSSSPPNLRNELAVRPSTRPAHYPPDSGADPSGTAPPATAAIRSAGRCAALVSAPAPPGCARRGSAPPCRFPASLRPSAARHRPWPRPWRPCPGRAATPPTAVWGQAVSHLSLVGPTRQLQ